MRLGGKRALMYSTVPSDGALRARARPQLYESLAVTSAALPLPPSRVSRTCSQRARSCGSASIRAAPRTAPSTSSRSSALVTLSSAERSAARRRAAEERAAWRAAGAHDSNCVEARLKVSASARTREGGPGGHARASAPVLPTATRALPPPPPRGLQRMAPPPHQRGRLQ